MFQYCQDVLHLSEAEAYRRIAAARVSRKYPVILEMLEDGRIHLAGISELKAHLTDANHKDVLSRATHKSRCEIKQLVAELVPKPDVPPAIRKLPQREAKSEPSKPAAELCPDTVQQNAPAAKPEPPPAAPNKPAKPAKLEPLAPARYKVAFTASEELRDKLERLQALTPGSDLASIIDAAVTEKLERLEAKRYRKTNKPRKNLEDADTSPGVRGVSAAVKRAVWERDGGRCTYVSDGGKRCPERHRLEFHHDETYARGGDRSADNLRLACHAHNDYMAEMDYGKAKMDQYRVREPQPTYGIA